MGSKSGRLFFISTCILLGLTWLAGRIFQYDPEFLELLYINGLYKAYRVIWYPLSWISPFPLFYIWLAGLFTVLVFIFFRIRKTESKLYTGLKYIFYLLAFHFIWFYWCWGFNYHRVGITGKWQLFGTIDSLTFKKECLDITNSCSSLRSKNFTVMSFDSLEPMVLDEMKNAFETYSFPFFDKVRSRQLSPNGLLLVWSTAGIYLPFSGEAQIDAGLHYLQKPFTLAHELAHVMAWTDEGECNFIAYLICRYSDHPMLQYSAELTYWKYLASNARRKQPELYKEMYAALSPEVKDDLRNIDEEMQKYPDLLPKLRDWMYDFYLKANGVKSGSVSYSQMVNLIIHYKEKNHLL